MAVLVGIWLAFGGVFYTALLLMAWLRRL